MNKSAIKSNKLLLVITLIFIAGILFSLAILNHHPGVPLNDLASVGWVSDVIA